MSNSNRLESLDSLRGIAAMGVVIYHYTSLFGYSQGFTQLIDFFPSPYDNPGRYGVELFFIISGFVITMSLENSKSVYHFFVAILTSLRIIEVAKNLVLILLCFYIFQFYV